MNQGNKIIVLNPVSGSTGGEAKRAPRLETLDGKVLGLVNNSKRNSDVFLHLISKRIESIYSLKDVIWIDKLNGSLPMPDELLKRLKMSCHAVITGVGD